MNEDQKSKAVAATFDDITLSCLQEFIRTFRASLDPRVWLALVKEEQAELEFELGRDPMVRKEVLKEASDLMYVTVGFNMVAAGPEQMGLYHPEEHAEAVKILEEATKTHEKAIDILGNVDYMEAFLRVHKSNMSKVGEDGEPVRRDDGKILKGPNYEPPKMDDLTSLLLLPERKLFL